MKTISLRDANQGFAHYVREVEAGEEFVITRNGEPVARLVPVRPATRQLTPKQEAALARIRARMAEGWPLGGEKFDREALYDRAIRRED
ncbi:MAG: type II toxin-antitoxin system prevent-host-death family antitoxin [Alphaproteobacteria bacterium]|nr:type II toxin-antitoxin system prevent-host-death family antitoxin [Alphaproteobacteria bacterium]